MSATWWKIRIGATGEYLVLVVGGRVAVTTCSCVTAGEMWAAARERLEGCAFECVMETL